MLRMFLKAGYVISKVDRVYVDHKMYEPLIEELYGICKNIVLEVASWLRQLYFSILLKLKNHNYECCRQNNIICYMYKRSEIVCKLRAAYIAIVSTAGYIVQFMPIRNAKSMTSGYNQAISHPAKYKVYLHQDVLL